MPIGPLDAVDGDLVYHIIDRRKCYFRYVVQINQWLFAWSEPIEREVA